MSAGTGANVSRPPAFHFVVDSLLQTLVQIASKSFKTVQTAQPFRAAYRLRNQRDSNDAAVLRNGAQKSHNP
jgi:hypothetical protein